jgi:hypothetical protein
MMMKTIALSMVLVAPGAYAQFGSAADAFNSAVAASTAGAVASVGSTLAGTYALCM